MDLGIFSTLLGPVFKIIDKMVPDQTKAMELKAEIEKMVVENQTRLIDAFREFGVTEMKGNWFQSSWRPLLSYTFIFIFLWTAFLKGVLEAVFAVNIETISMEDVMSFGTVWATVYGLGRTFEKSGRKIEFKK